MRIFTKLLAASAAIAATTPAAAQYYGNRYSGYSQPYAQTYGYSQPYARTYSQSYGYAQPYAVNTGVAAQQCSAAVQSRLYNRSSMAGFSARCSEPTQPA